MIAAHCSKTFENFFGLKNLPSDKNISEINTWSVQIFRADGQKHLFFLNHFTHFSVVVYNIKKKDKEALDHLFWEAFISEVRRANISSDRIEKTLQKHFEGITYCSKSRNKKTNQSLIDRKTVFQVLPYLTVVQTVFHLSFSPPAFPSPLDALLSYRSQWIPA